MIRIVEGSIAEVKAEMQEVKGTIKSKIKGYKKTCYERGRFIGTASEGKAKKKLERTLELYAVSRSIPVKVGTIVINYKLLEDFLKKLKAARPTLEAGEGKLVLRYEGTVDRRKGYLELYDMSEYYGDLKKIPLAEILE